jgi:CBS domain containing-hemolysin-like protein
VIAPLDVLAENEPIVSMFALIVMPACATRLKELLALLLIIAELIVIVPESVPGSAATNAPVLIQLAVEEFV